MKSIERGKRKIKKFIKTQLIVTVIIITTRGIIYGTNTGKLSTALLTAITLLAFASLFAQDIYGSYEPPGKILNGFRMTRKSV